MDPPTFHIAMYPWFALGHLTPFLQLSNKLAEKGHKISFILPTRTQLKLQTFNLLPDLITFVPITVPHVDGLPHGTETTSDVPAPLHSLVMTAMDRTQKNIEILLHDLNVDIVFFDFTHWMPGLARRLGIKSLHYSITCPGTTAFALSLAPRVHENNAKEAEDFPLLSIKLHVHEAIGFAAGSTENFGRGIKIFDRLLISLKECDALGFRSYRELDGPSCDFLESYFQKPVMLSGPLIPEPPNSSLDEKWVKWLAKFEPGSVIYCAFGSECTLKKDQFQELLLGFEQMGMPFLAVLRPPLGVESVEAAIPRGFNEGVGERGVVHEGWIQQQLILEHPAVGCFVTHCGVASLVEALMNKCQLVLLPQAAGDQIIQARIMSTILKVGIEVEKGEEDGLFTRDSLCKAVRTVMEKDNEVGKEVRSNRSKIREFLLNKEMESSYINSFCEKIENLVLGR